MPTYAADNSAWDQGLASLGSALFPDPSKIAQGYAYGTQARKAQIESSQLQSQMNAQALALQNAARMGQPPAAPSFTTSPQGTTMVAPPSLGTIVSQAQATAAQTPALIEPFTQGTPPAMSSPAPGAGAPPAPTTTTTAGTSPSNDAMSGVFMPGSVTTPDGGAKQAGPAASNGAPAPIAINPQMIYALNLAAGKDHASAAGATATYLSTLLNNNQITKRQYYELLAGAGVTTPLTQTIGEEGALARTKLTEAGATQRTGMTQAGETQRANITAETQRMQPVYLARPDNPLLSDVVRTDQAAGRTAFTPTALQSATQYNPYVNPAIPGALPAPQTNFAASQGGSTPALSSQEQVNAQMGQQIAMAKPGSPEQAAAINRYLAVNQGTKPLDATEANKQRMVDQVRDQGRYPLPQTGWGRLGVDHPVAFAGDAELAISRRMLQMQASDFQLRGNHDLARQMAIESLQRDGSLPSVEDLNKLRDQFRAQRILSLGGAGDPRVIMLPTDPKNPGKTSPHVAVNLTDKGRAGLGGAGGAPAAPGAKPPPGTLVPGGAMSGPATGPAGPPPLTTSMTTPMPAGPAGPPPETPLAAAQPVPQPPVAPVDPSIPAAQPPPAAAAAAAPAAPVPPPDATPISSILGRILGLGIAPPSASQAAAPAAPAAPTTVSGAVSTAAPLGKPAGAIMEAKGVANYTPVMMNNGQPGIVMNGWVYPR